MINNCLQCPHEGRDNIYCRTCEHDNKKNPTFAQILLDVINKQYIDDFVEKYATMFPSFFTNDVCVWVACQSALETGYGTSAIFQENHNLFGMKKPNVRPTYATGVNRGHAVYNNHAASFLDYVLLLTYQKVSRNDCKDINNFALFIERIGYCPSSRYTKTINSIFNEYGRKN